MKTRSILILAILILIGYGLYRLGLRAGTLKSVESAGTIEVEKKPLYWHDPMNPNQRFDKPGKSPYMDMELVPVYANENNSDGNHVSIDSRIQQNLGIRTTAVIKGKLDSNLIAVGSVAYDERDVAFLQSRSNGYVEHVYVRAALDPVKKGQKLAEIYVPDWIAAQEEYFTVQHMQGNNLEAMIDGARQRMLLAGMSEEQVSQVTSSGKVQTRIAITAPISGVITELFLREGMTVNLGAPLFRINGVSRIWVNAEVPESLASQVHIGDLVEARTATLTDAVFKGRVNAILAEVNPTTRTLKARIELSNPNGVLAPGMFATIHFLSNRLNQEVILIPSEAVIQTGMRSVVMVEQAKGQYTAVDIETGAEANEQTEVTKGLKAGQKVVVSGQFLIDSEASLKGTALRMSDTDPKTKSQGAVK